MNYLFVAQSGECFGVPVDHAYPAVNQPFIVEIDENFQYTFGTHLVHRESRALPVAGGTEFFQLFQDDSTMLVCPFPGVFQKFITAEICFTDTLRCQPVYNFCFCGNGSMIGTRHPAGIFAQHACAANEYVLYGIVQHVSHVQHTGYIGRWNYDGIRFTFIGFGVEKIVVQPILIPFILHFRRIIFACKFHIIYYNLRFSKLRIGAQTY